MRTRSILTTAVKLSLVFALPLWAQSRNPNLAQSPNTRIPALQPGVKYQPLNVKPGLWERTSTVKTAGHLPIPAGMLDKLTPDQRARFEARMNASPSGKSRTTTEQSCLTKQQLEEPINLGRESCALTISESTTTKAAGSIVCNIQGMQMSGNAQFEAPDQEHITGTEHVTSTGNGNSMTTDATFTSRWLGSNCANVQ